MARSDADSVKAPVPVLMPVPRIIWPPVVGASALPHEQPAACAAGNGGGVLVVRALAVPDAAETAWLPSARVAVIVTKYPCSAVSVQPSCTPKLRQNCRGVAQAVASAGESDRDSCAVPVSGSYTVAIQEAQPPTP